MPTYEHHRRTSCRSLLEAVQLPVARDDAPRAAREAVGRWGERYVAAYLQAHAQPGMENQYLHGEPNPVHAVPVLQVVPH